MQIRLYEKEDAAALTTLMRRSILELAIKNYSTAQVTAWAARVSDAHAFHTRATDGRTIWVAVNETGPLAFIDLEPNGHIDLFFCTPETTGTGTASKLFDTLETHARQTNIKTLTTNASETAKRLFLKNGFELVERCEIEINGVGIHNFVMEKELI